MDPLSLTASIIAVLGAASAAAQALEKLRSIRHAPQQILVVLNEVSDFRTVIVTLQTITQDLGQHKSQDPKIIEHIESLIKKSQSILDKINIFVRAGLIKNFQHMSTEGIRVSWRIWLRKQRHLQELSEHLANVRKDITTALTVLIAAEVPRVRIDLQSIVFNNREIGSSMQALENSTRSRLESMAEEVSTIQPSLDTLQAVLQQLQLTGHEPPPVAPPYQVGESQKDASRNPIPSTFQVQTSLRRSCSELCPCHCHKSTNLNSPQWMKGLIGSIFIGYSGVPLAKRQPCTEKICLKEHQTLLKVSYFFPTWFMGRMLVFRDRYSPLDGHSISVRTPKTLDGNSPAVWAAVHGNVESMRDLFAKGMASPFDVDDLGQSLLGIALAYRKLDVCKLLLESYADPDHENITARLRSSIDILWNCSIRDPSNKLNHELQRVLSHYLDPSENFRKRHFSTIHQVVLGLAPLDLEKQLRSSTAEIDAKCSMGRTPLSWAASRSDIFAVKTLLSYGAEINIADKAGRNPIYHATKANGDETDILQTLLKAAAVMASRRSSYEAPERFRDTSESPVYDQASQISDDFEEEEFDESDEEDILKIPHPSVKALVNQEDNEGWTPLHYAALDDKCSRALVLLSYGASVNPAKSLLLFAIQFNSHKLISLLLFHGVSIEAVDDENQGILHYAAAFGDLVTLSILDGIGEMWGVESDMRDTKGETPMQIWDASRASMIVEDAEEREKCRVVFENLLRNARGGKGKGKEVFRYREESVDDFESDDEDEEHFFDAESDVERIYHRPKT